MSWLTFGRSGIPARFAMRPHDADPMNLWTQALLSQMPDVTRDAEMDPRRQDMLAQIMAGQHQMLPDLLYAHQGLHRRSPMRAFDQPGNVPGLVDLYERMSGLGEDHPALQAYTPGTAGYQHGDLHSRMVFHQLMQQGLNRPDAAARIGWGRHPYLSGLTRALQNVQGQNAGGLLEQAGSGSLAHLLKLMQLPTGGEGSPMDEASRLIHLHEQLLRPAIGAGIGARNGVFGGLMYHPGMFPSTQVPPEYVMPNMTEEPDDMMTRRTLGMGEGRRHFG